MDFSYLEKVPNFYGFLVIVIPCLSWHIEKKTHEIPSNQGMVHGGIWTMLTTGSVVNRNIEMYSDDNCWRNVSILSLNI